MRRFPPISTKRQNNAQNSTVQHKKPNRAGGTLCGLILENALGFQKDPSSSLEKSGLKMLE
jgi:ribosomal protein L34E